MSDEIAAHDDNASDWTHATSDDGVKYVTGVPNTDDSGTVDTSGTADGGDDGIADDGTPAGLADATDPPVKGKTFSAAVNWPVGPRFVPLLPDERKRTHIASYRLCEVPVNPSPQVPINESGCCSSAPPRVAPTSSPTRPTAPTR
jgi:hypothetical protein